MLGNNKCFAINIGFGLYLFPSLFLAFDRVLVVMFPLTFRNHFGKLRMFKAVIFSIRFTLVIADSVFEIVFGMFASSSIVLKSINLGLLILVLLAIIVLYSTMAAQIVWSSKRMANSRQVRQNSR